MSFLNETHDVSLQSWVASANAVDNGFPIQNLPFATFRTAQTQQAFRPGLAIGDMVLDLAALAEKSRGQVWPARPLRLARRTI